MSLVSPSLPNMITSGSKKVKMAAATIQTLGFSKAVHKLPKKWWHHGWYVHYYIYGPGAVTSWSLVIIVRCPGNQRRLGYMFTGLLTAAIKKVRFQEIICSIKDGIGKVNAHKPFLDFDLQIWAGDQQQAVASWQYWLLREQRTRQSYSYFISFELSLRCSCTALYYI